MIDMCFSGGNKFVRIMGVRIMGLYCMVLFFVQNISHVVLLAWGCLVFARQ